MKRNLIVLMVLLASSSPLFAIDIVVPGYDVEVVATYTKGGVQGLAFDNQGNLYATHPSDKCIWKIAPDGTASQFVSGIAVCGLVFGGGTSFGDYLYTPDGQIYGSKIRKIGLDGSVSNFASFDPPKHCPSPIAIDTTGNYGGNMFSATAGQDRTYKVTASGSVSLFADFPGWRDGGGPADIIFDNTGNYGNSMIMATSFSNVSGNEYMSGLWKLSPSGQATRIIPETMYPSCMDIDKYGDFGGKLYVTAKKTLVDTKLEIWAVEPDGSHWVFATTVNFLGDVIFSSDGAMYVSEYENGQTTIYKVYPTKNLTSIDIMGPTEVAENSQIQYKAIASYDDGSEKDVTSDCKWFADNCDFAGIEPNGLFYSDMTLYLNQTCNIYAEYTTDANEVLTAEKKIAILPMCPTGSSLAFDGVDDYVNLGSSEILKPELPVSISCWLNISKMEHAMGVVLLGYTNNRYTGIWMDVFLDKKIQISFGNGGSQGASGRRTFRASKVLEEKKWYYVNAIIYDATKMDVYIDGIKYEGEYSGSGSNLVYSNGESRLGFGLVNNLEYYFDGQIDEVSIFNRALTAEEVQYNMYHKLAGNEAGLVGYWDFDEGQGQIANDKSGNGNDGQLGGSVEVQISDPNWVSPGVPFICTKPALAKRNISLAKEIKQDIIEDLDYALKAELAANTMLLEVQRDKQFKNIWPSANIVRARMQTFLAIVQERIARSKIIVSINNLADALEFLNAPAEEPSVKSGKTNK